MDMFVCVGNFVRMLVRPVITLGLVAALIYEGVIGNNSEVVTALVGMSGVATTFWFNDRGQQNRPAEDGQK